MTSHRKQHVLSSLDRWATNIVRPQNDVDVLDLDQSFWLLASQVSKTHADMARDVFGLSPALVDELAELETSTLGLASGVLLSFAPVFTEDAFDKAYAQALLPKDPSAILGNRPVDIMYWQTLVRISEKRGTAAAAIVFGVPKRVVALVTDLGFSGARGLANALNVGWALRCRAGAVSNALKNLQQEGASPTNPLADAIMVRLAQSLSHIPSIR